MLSKPKVSIVIPNYNHAKFLKDRISSILSQTYKNFELVVLDDASSDNSLQIIDEMLRDVAHRSLANRTNSGSPFEQWIKGVNIANGEYVWIAESDDVAHSDFLEIAIRRLDAGADLFYSRNYLIDADGHRIYRPYWGDELDSAQFKEDFTMAGIDFVHNFMLFRNVIPNASAVVFRKSIFSINKQVLSLRCTGDWLAWALTLYKAGITVSYSARELDMHRCHPGTTREPTAIAAERQAVAEAVKVVNLIRQMVNSNPLLLATLPWSRELQWIRKSIWRIVIKRRGIFILLDLAGFGIFGLSIAAATLIEHIGQRLRMHRTTTEG